MMIEDVLTVVPRDGVLMVHAGFRGLSRASWRADDFIERLLEHLAGGTLCMPAMSWRTVTPSQPTFDELETPSHVGIVAEIFRTKYATARSLHPTHSVCAAGAAAKELLAQHHFGTTPCGPNSPFNLIRGRTAFALMIACGLERCTAIHTAEEAVAPDVYLQDDHVKYSVRSRQGWRRSFWLRAHRRLNRCFEKFEPALEAKGKLIRGDIHGVPCMLVDYDSLLDEVAAALRADPRACLAPAGAKTRLAA